ncbi:Endoplasmic reticulum metallopeptidase 1 [Hypsibius exemplaris]|uniref:FXNA-like protease n=1 Tax=Hypsibius exemplaris TaxID=2072580 RepID=A0A9X6NEX4_HYPEX|nr:Endoplasmic reticulum metallopeptidase 1 [Hypsibius exemplaris]
MSGEGVRRRVAQKNRAPIGSNGQQDDHSTDDGSAKLGWAQWIFLSIYFTGVVYGSQFIGGHLPKPWPSSDHGDIRDLSRFSEDRATQHLLTLTSFRPRTVGTDGNDKFSVKYFLKEAEAIRKKASPVNLIEIDHQVVSGSFRLAFLNGFNNVYQNIHNVLVRIGPLHEYSESNRTLLVNCHFDAAIGVDGASDDLSQCVTMLEALTVLAQRAPLKHRVLFLFNGAEESILQASHGFVTQHPWAQDVTAFINLEAAGSGGRDVLFQTGPKHPWLVRAYALVPFPCGNSFGEEIFQSGIIPSDTDFRIFRDHGSIPGVDIAYVENGYVYHTHYDRVEQITPGTLQRSGENLISLIYGIVTSPEFQDLENCVECATDSAVYFDFLGIAFITYSHRSGVIVNCIFVLAAIATIFAELRLELITSGVYTSSLRKAKLLGLGIAAAVTAVIVPVVSVACLAYLVSFVAPMSWYASPHLAFFLYGCPTVGMVFAVHRYFLSGRVMASTPIGLRESIIYHSVGFLWMIVLIVTTSYGLNSAFVPLLFLAGPLPIRVMWLNFQPLTRRDLTAFLTAHMTSVSIPTIFGLYTLLSMLRVFIPIFGRSGSELNPDVALAVLVSFSIACLMSYYGSLVHVTDLKSSSQIAKLFAGITFGTVLLISLTPIGFPYSSPPNGIAPKRLALQHFHREDYDLAGKQVSEDNGLWIVPLDFIGIKPLSGIFNLTGALSADCVGKLYCGLPFIYPIIKLFRHHLVVPVREEPRLPHHPLLVNTGKESITERLTKWTFSAELVDHSNIYISPAAHCRLTGWNLTAAEPMNGPEWNGRPTYFVFLVAGYEAGKTKFDKVFSIELECRSGLLNSSDASSSSSSSSPVAVESVRITVVNHFLAMTSPLLDRVLTQLPSWVAEIHWLNSLQSYVF